MDDAKLTPEERDAARAEVEAEIREYEDYLGTVAADLAAQTDPANYQDPVIFQTETWEYILQLHADAVSYVDYLNQLNDHLNSL